MRFLPDATLATPARRAVYAVVALAVLLAIQPLFIGRVPERQTEFTWEMFAKGGPRDEFVVDLGDRSIRRSIADLVDPARANTDYSVVLPPHICLSMPDAESVTVLRADQEILTYECQR